MEPRIQIPTKSSVNSDTAGPRAGFEEHSESHQAGLLSLVLPPPLTTCCCRERAAEDVSQIAPPQVRLRTQGIHMQACRTPNWSAFHSNCFTMPAPHACTRTSANLEGPSHARRGEVPAARVLSALCCPLLSHTFYEPPKLPGAAALSGRDRPPGGALGPSMSQAASGGGRKGNTGVRCEGGVCKNEPRAAGGDLSCPHSATEQRLREGLRQ